MYLPAVTFLGSVIFSFFIKMLHNKLKKKKKAPAILNIYIEGENVGPLGLLRNRPLLPVLTRHCCVLKCRCSLLHTPSDQLPATTTAELSK